MQSNPEFHHCLMCVRLRIHQNICTVYVRLGQYNDAIATYEHIMSEMKDKADFKTGAHTSLLIQAHPSSLPQL